MLFALFPRLILQQDRGLHPTSVAWIEGTLLSTAQDAATYPPTHTIVPGPMAVPFDPPAGQKGSKARGRGDTHYSLDNTIDAQTFERPRTSPASVQ